jgi:hypothetical protein
MPQRQDFNSRWSLSNAVVQVITHPGQANPSNSGKTYILCASAYGRLRSHKLKRAFQFLDKGTGGSRSIRLPPLSCFFDSARCAANNVDGKLSAQELRIG